jgi:hypothetical protein
MQCSTRQYSEVQCSAVLRSTVYYGTAHDRTVRCTQVRLRLSIAVSLSLLAVEAADLGSVAFSCDILRTWKWTANSSDSEDALRFHSPYGGLSCGHLVWCIVVWCRVVYCGVVSCGMVRCGMVQCGVVRFGLPAVDRFVLQCSKVLSIFLTSIFFLSYFFLFPFFLCLDSSSKSVEGQ